MWKLFAIGLTSALGISLAGLFQGPPDGPDDGPPPPKAKAKDKAKEKEKTKKGEPRDELRKTYELLRRVRSDSGGGRTQERIKEWTDRATDLYRRAIRAREESPRRARETALAAHDLARAADHAANAARLDRSDPELPPPPDGPGPEGTDERTRRDLFRAYERIHDAPEYGPEADPKFYFDAAKSLYNAARRDVEAGRDERGGELARAAEAMTHVPEHLSNAAAGGPGARPDPEKPEPKKKAHERERPGFDPPPDEKAKREAPRDRDLPPPLD